MAVILSHDGMSNGSYHWLEYHPPQDDGEFVQSNPWQLVYKLIKLGFEAPKLSTWMNWWMDGLYSIGSHDEVAGKLCFINSECQPQLVSLAMPSFSSRGSNIPASHSHPVPTLGTTAFPAFPAPLAVLGLISSQNGAKLAEAGEVPGRGRRLSGGTHQLGQKFGRTPKVMATVIGQHDDSPSDFCAKANEKTCWDLGSNRFIFGSLEVGQLMSTQVLTAVSRSAPRLKFYAPSVADSWFLPRIYMVLVFLFFWIPGRIRMKKKMDQLTIFGRPIFMNTQKNDHLTRDPGWAFSVTSMQVQIRVIRDQR